MHNPEVNMIGSLISELGRSRRFHIDLIGPQPMLADAAYVRFGCAP
jgi:hypothetical protein